jgi:hypothetical protein
MHQKTLTELPSREDDHNHKKEKKSLVQPQRDGRAVNVSNKVAIAASTRQEVNREALDWSDVTLETLKLLVRSAL